MTNLQFDAFVAALAPEDKHEFYVTFKGTDKLLRYVCALDLLMGSGAKSEGARGNEREAYAMAYDCSLEESSKRYRAALEHDAVQDLLSRLRYRGRAMFWIRMENKGQRLLETLIDDATTDKTLDMKERVLAFKALMEYGKTVRRDDIQEAIARTQRGFTAGQDAAIKAYDHAKPEEMKTMLKELRSALGPNNFDSYVAEVQQKELPA